jgi:hypothetical protein
MAAPRVWDIEDLVSLGKSVGACPYFAARALQLEADLVICPYSYLVGIFSFLIQSSDTACHQIDPVIREAMGIKLNKRSVSFV